MVSATAVSPPPSTPTPTPMPAPPDVAVGGDQPMGPLPPSIQPGMPENVNASPEFLALKDDLAEEITAYSARVGGIDVAIAVTDLETGETISVSGNVPHRTGCTINMFALLAVVGEFEAGRADPQSVAYNIRVGIGGSYPPEVRRFLVKVFPSYQAGLTRAQEMMRSWGMVASQFHQVPYYQTGTGINQLTALEVNMIVGRLYGGELFSPEWTAYTLARLREVNAGLNYMLPGQLPRAATVAHKIGFYSDWDGWVNNDAGVVTFTGGDGKTKAYAITYLSQEARTEYTGYSFGARLSRIVWDWFEATYRLGVEPPPPPSTTPSPEPTPQPPVLAAPTSEPTPSPTPVATPTPSQPTPTPTPEPTPSPTPTSVPTPTPSPTPGPTPTPTPAS
jgi:cell division septation protein DedD